MRTQASGDGETVSNDSQLQTFCKALSTRYLQNSDSPAQIQAGAGFIPYTIDGVVAEVEIDQRAVMTRFHVNTWFRPLGSYLASEFRRMVEHHHESHPHEAKTEGKRTAMDQSGSNQPSVPLTAFAPTAPPGSFLVFATKDGGTMGSSTTTCNATYTVTDLSGNNLADGSNTKATNKTPVWNNRLPKMAYTEPVEGTPAGWAYYTNTTIPTLVLLWVNEGDPYLIC